MTESSFGSLWWRKSEPYEDLKTFASLLEEIEEECRLSPPRTPTSGYWIVYEYCPAECDEYYHERIARDLIDHVFDMLDGQLDLWRSGFQNVENIIFPAALDFVKLVSKDAVVPAYWEEEAEWVKTGRERTVTYSPEGLYWKDTLGLEGFHAWTDEEEEQVASTPTRKPSVGVDLGIKELAVLSDGTVFPGDQYQ